MKPKFLKRSRLESVTYYDWNVTFPPLNMRLLLAGGSIKTLPRRAGFFTNLRRYLQTGVWF